MFYTSVLQLILLIFRDLFFCHVLKSFLLFFGIACFQLTSFAQVQIGKNIEGEAAGDYSGRSVSMPDAYTIAIGANGNDGNGSEAGHVRIYKWNGKAWVQKGNDIDGEAAGDYSGHSVSMPDSNTVAIGAFLNRSSGFRSGHVRIYKWNGNAWVQKGSDIDGEASGDISAYSISMPDSNTIAIGAPNNSGNDSTAGHVRVYRWNGSLWLQKGIDIDGEAAGDLSGFSVSMSDSITVAIGAIHNDGNGKSAGHVRVYRWNGSLWLQKGIDIDGEAADDWSGYSVSMPDSNAVAIGAPHNKDNGNNSGHVRIYRWNGSTWIQKGNDIDGEAANDLSGGSISMPDSNTIAIGAKRNEGSGTNAGHVRVYSWNGGAWVQIGTDIDGVAANDLSGGSISMPDSDTIAIGAERYKGNGIDAGHVRIYSICATINTISITTCNSYISPSGKYTWTKSGHYYDVLENAAGCDSVISVRLIVMKTFETLVVRECYNYISPSGNYIWTTSGQYKDTLVNFVGCDSVITINLT